MLQDNSKKKPSNLFIVIGTNFISSGLTNGRRSNYVWQDNSLSHVNIRSENSTLSSQAQLLQALTKLIELNNYKDVNKIRVLIADSWLVVTELPLQNQSIRENIRQREIYTKIVTSGYEIDPADTIRSSTITNGATSLAIVYPSIILNALEQLSKELNASLESVLALSAAAWNINFNNNLESKNQANRSNVQIVIDEGIIIFSRSSTENVLILGESSVRTNIDINKDLYQQIYTNWLRLIMRDNRMKHVRCADLLDLTNSDELKEKKDVFFKNNKILKQNNTSVPLRLILAAQVSGVNSDFDAISTSADLKFLQWSIVLSLFLVALVLVFKLLDTNSNIQALSAKMKLQNNQLQTKKTDKTLSAEKVVKVKAVNEAIKALNFPLAFILRELEPPRDIKVALLSLENSPDGSSSLNSSKFKIVAEAKNSLDMTNYVAFVSSRKSFSNAYLLQHEINLNLTDRPYRFTLEATWKE